MRFAEIQHGSPEYRMECELRHEVLRVPLGMNLYDEDLCAETQQSHFGLFLPGGTLVACAIAAPVSPGEMKIRQMAVRADSQGQGYGRMLLVELQHHLAKSGIREISLHARSSAVAFYEALGFAKSGPEFTEVGIPHLKMTKSL